MAQTIIRCLKLSWLCSVLALSAFSAFAPTPLTAQGESLRAPFTLELPELAAPPITAPEVAVSAGELTRLRLRVHQPFAAQIDYGKIFTTINGEAANTIASKGADLDGYIIDLQLDKKPRFRLQPGKNVIEISAADRDGRNWYASYVLRSGLLRSGNGLISNDSFIADGATVEEFSPAAVLAKADADNQPPGIYLTRPAGTLFLPGSSLCLKVSGWVQDDTDPNVLITINGQAIPPSTADAAAGNRGSIMVGGASAKDPVRFEHTLTLTDKTPALVIEAKDRAANLTRLTIPVRLREPPNAERFIGRKYALVIGVSRYRHHERGLNDLLYADADARAFRDYLQRPEGGGFAPSDILFQENEQASLTAVRAAFNRFLPLAGPDDLIVIFIAGHGAPDPDAPQNLYFLLHDSRATDMARTAMPMIELREILDNRLRARRVIVFVDTCHSAGLSGQQLVTRDRRLVLENNLVNLYAARLFRDSGRAVITSADVNETAKEGENWGAGHGVFTWVLLKGLEGDADANDDQFVTAGELFLFVRDRVHLETRGEQTPRALIGINAQLTLAKVTRKR